jgi:hypothetical protein
MNIVSSEDEFAKRHRLKWTVKGVDPAVREMSKKAARKAGMRVGSWVELALRNAAERGCNPGDRR